MLQEKEIRLVFFVLFFVSIALYELIGLATDYISSFWSVNLKEYESIQIGKYLASVLLVLVSFKSKRVIRLAGFDYIGGMYEGQNREVSSEGTASKSSQESFVIFQSLLKTTISGTSTNEEAEFHSLWQGDLIERKDNIYTFSIAVETSQKRHFGLLKIRFENGKANGLVDYYEAGKVSSKDTLTAVRVSEKAYIKGKLTTKNNLG